MGRELRDVEMPCLHRERERRDAAPRPVEQRVVFRDVRRSATFAREDLQKARSSDSGFIKFLLGAACRHYLARDRGSER